MSNKDSKASRPLRPEVHWATTNRLPALLFAISVAGIGGFLGGALMSYGPQYLNIYVTEAYETGEKEQAVALAALDVVSESPIQEPEEAPIEQAAALPEGADARLVMHAKHKSYVVLDSSPKAEWGTGRVRVSGDGFEFDLTQDVDPQLAREETARWLGRELSMYNGSGYVCRVKVTGFELLQKSFEDGVDQNSMSREFYEGGFQMVAGLEVMRGKCGSAVWARDASLPAPSIGRLVRTSKAERALARKHFRRSAAWKVTQKRFRADGGQGKWDRQWDAGPLVRTMRGAEEELILVSANTAGCGEPGGALAALFRVEDDKSLSEIDGGGVYIHSISAGADIDGDGDLDLIGASTSSDTVLVKQAPSLVVESRSYTNINFCGC